MCLLPRLQPPLIWKKEAEARQIRRDLERHQPQQEQVRAESRPPEDRRTRRRRRGGSMPSELNACFSSGEADTHYGRNKHLELSQRASSPNSLPSTSRGLDLRSSYRALVLPSIRQGPLCLKSSPLQNLLPACSTIGTRPSRGYTQSHGHER